MSRDKLPSRRTADVVTFLHEGRRWTVTAGRFADGRVGEIFIDAPKESPLADAAREAAIITSIALQHGASLDVIRHALDGRDQSLIGAALALLSGAGGSHA